MSDLVTPAAPVSPASPLVWWCPNCQRVAPLADADRTGDGPVCCGARMQCLAAEALRR